MTSPKEYREFALECGKQAATTQDERLRKVLMNTARLWMQMALEWSDRGRSRTTSNRPPFDLETDQPHAVRPAALLSLSASSQRAIRARPRGWWTTRPRVAFDEEAFCHSELFPSARLPTLEPGIANAAASARDGAGSLH
jgi:hypothetical protein